MKKLPIGNSSFVKMRELDLLYVDKTKHVANLVENGQYYFLSRPRRFGKSSFLDTLKQAFLGREDLFRGLYLEHNWDWSKKYPVVHISFASGEMKSTTDLNNLIDGILKEEANTYQISLEFIGIPSKFKELITKLYHKYNQQVVILIDEYDKPILDNITDLEISSEMRSGLRNLYSVIKDCDEYLKLTFITGISRFIKTGIFSTLNNLLDITLDKRYSDICGYTEMDLDTAFAEYLVGVDRKMLKYWYNGYNFLGTEAQKVYNPFAMLLFLDSDKEFSNYWFSNSTPSFLINLLKTRNYILPNFENIEANDSMLESFDVENIGIEALLFQTGYVTITRVSTQVYSGTKVYTMNYPNFEVRKSLNSSLLNGYFGTVPDMYSAQAKFPQAVFDNEFDQLQQIIFSFFASIPHDWYRNNTLQNHEAFYATVIYTFFNSVGIPAIPEDTTNHGQIDLSITLPDKIILFEFKIKEQGGTLPLEQIKAHKYPEKYLAQNKPIYLVGVVFSRAERNIVDFVWERYK